MMIFFALSACLSPVPRTDPGSRIGSLTPTSKGERLTPTSKGERLTPTSKGERRGDGRIQGLLLLDQGQAGLPAGPVAHALVGIEGTDISVHSDAGGYFEIPDAPVGGDFALVAEKADSEGHNFRVRVQTRLDSTHRSLNMGSLTLKATGRVSGRVTLADRALPEGIGIFIPGTELATRTDREGRFALADVPEGDYHISAYKAGYAPTAGAPLQVRSGQVADATALELAADSRPERFGTLAGRITSQGQPLAGAQVVLAGSQLLAARAAISNAQGEYRIEGIEPSLPAAHYTLLVSRPFYQPATANLSLSAGETVQGDFELSSETLTLGRLQLQVQDCAGQPVAVALIQLDPTPALGPVPFTDNRGQIGLGQLLPGKYTVYAAKGERSSFAGIVIDNQATGSDGQAGALAKLKLVLGKNCK
ncbi:MAG: carboxypeptidase regulatory-like domain-containing protein [Candidatus Sericytochromatia bacterium]